MSNESNTSSLYAPISSEEIINIMKDTFGADCDVLHTSLLKGGLFNTTYLIETTSPEGKWVLRLAPQETEHLYSFEKQMMAVEPHIYRLLESEDIPSSRVIRYDESGSLIVRPYLIIEFIDSIPLNDPSILPEDYARLKEELGRYTRQMHHLTSDRFGWPQPDGTVRGYPTWSQMLLELSTEVVDRCSVYHVFEEQILQEFAAVFHDNAELFDEITVPSLVHNDLWDPNVLVRRGGDGELHIAALIDADRAVYADREYEFIVYENHPNFMQGYGYELSMEPRPRARRTAYQMMLSFLCAFVYEIQLAMPENATWCKKDALAQLQAFRELWSEATMEGRSE
ncbi:aminoglycoside phosphotransferase family protein [Paenibacillus guangzhouensis]|uniref:aminoglycoside phosphotransferase family protein n=1 Tax=Paenibacillus guangzhouensis TaxID=1473112 RepID=UPI001266AC73|nr:aminoglycoside phosphotransferase family protein [Paenibacillus guangzhouensis]